MLVKNLGDNHIDEKFSCMSTRKDVKGRLLLDKSNAVNEEIESRREKLSQINEIVNENELYMQSLGGQSNRWVYGLGSQASECYKTGGASSSLATFPPAQPAEPTPELLNTLNKLQQQITEQNQLIHFLQECCECLE
ncbi:conserved hypothetical protein [Ricinus communis]|uniref:Uncharacterized protein n=1 Tax=Ricinus communis TaxID=3988 RepID=B9T800_RICCO|nr:conserved hypothetical protein [Ricinus communis]